ncbi:DEAD-domain-containing protein [Clavulina sp. PMI_390]|nr:DEAD-domain-containing protein [Clavulina sp. PMI_390]
METAKIKIPKALERQLQRRQARKSHSRVPPLPQAPDSDSDSDDGSASGETTFAWRPVARSQLRTGFDDAAVLAFEEIDDVDVVYEETEGGGKVAKLQPKRSRGSETAVETAPQRPTKKRRLNAVETNIPFDESKLPEWSEIPLAPMVKERLYEAGFTSPTEIQSQTLPSALDGRDVVGVAETGSGKTLAYGLPIIQHAITAYAASSDNAASRRPLKALVLTPTRELALQVCEHLRAMCPPVLPADDDGVRPPPIVSVAAIVGGMSSQKQKRILERGVDILIGTPGRLWDIIQEDDSIASQIRSARFLVLDEADRMIETGHFQELENIVKLTIRPGSKDADATEKDPEFAALEKAAGLAADESPANESMQTFVFSATLSKDLQRNLKKHGRTYAKKSQTTTSTLDDLLMRLDFRDADPQVVDLSPEGGVVSTLHEAKVHCTKADKDLYLYYFLLRYPGRTLVFVSSIDSIRHIMPLLDILQVPAYPLHSQLQQKQRLKNLDRFKSGSTGVLIATDVAARGLDVPSVDHVVHYQLPRTADVFVHRNGRTARAKREGFSLQLCGPDEQKAARALLQSLGRAEDVPELAIDYDMMAKLKERVTLARSIDNAQHGVQKENHEEKWLRETAEALDIDLDSDMETNAAPRTKKRKARGAEDDDDGGVGHSNNKRKGKLSALRAEMKALLAQPLIARGVSTRYLTSGSKSVVDDLLTSSNHQHMLGVATSAAQHDVVRARRKTLGKAGQRKPKKQ